MHIARDHQYSLMSLRKPQTLVISPSSKAVGHSRHHIYLLKEVLVTSQPLGYAGTTQWLLSSLKHKTAAQRVEPRLNIRDLINFLYISKSKEVLRIRIY